MNRCPYCGEEIETTTVKCKYCGENIDKSLEIKRLPINIVILALIAISCIIAMIILFVNLSINRMDISHEEARERLRAKASALNQALFMHEALNGVSCDTPEKLQEALFARLYIDENASQGNLIVLNDGATLKIMPLNPNCDRSPDNGNYGKETACAQIIVDINGKARPNKHKIDQFSLFAYKNGIVPKKNSIEDKVIYKEQKHE